MPKTKKRNTSKWSKLPSEILQLVMMLLDLADISCLAAVCSPWRKEAKCYARAGRLSLRNMPGMVLSDNPRLTAACLIGAYKGLSTDQSWWCRGALGLWLVVEVKHESDETYRSFLLHAFLRNRFELPLYPEGIKRINKAILSSPPTISNSVVAAILSTGELAYCRPAGTMWTLFEAPRGFQDIAFYNGKLYAVDHEGFLWYFEIEKSTKGMKLNVPVPSDWSSDNHTMLFLLKSNGRLLMVVRHRCCTFLRTNSHSLNVDQSKFVTTHFQVFEMDVSWESWVQVRGLPNQALFLSRIHSELLPAAPAPLTKGNSIYFVDDEKMKNICEFEHGKWGITHINWKQRGAIFFFLFSSSGLPSETWKICW